MTGRETDNLDRIRSELLHELDSYFGPLTPSSIAIIADQIEEVLRTFLKQVIRNVAEFYGFRTNQTDSYLYYDNRVFQVEIATDIFQPDLLNIAILERRIKTTNRHRRPIRIGLDTSGTYSKVHIYISENAKIESEKITGIIEAVLNTGYSWLTEKLRQVIIHTEDKFAISLLSHLRQSFAAVQKEKLLPLVWLLLVSENDVFYVLDRLAGEQVIAQTKKRLITTGESPAKLSSEIFTKSLPYDLSFSKVALDKGNRIDIDARDAKYRTQLSTFEIAEEALFNTPSISMQAIVSSKKYSLVAAYPTDLAREIEPIFVSQKENIETLVNNSAKKLQKAWNRLDKKLKTSLPVGTIGEFLGGFAKGLINP